MYKDIISEPLSVIDTLTGNSYFIGENGDPSGVHTQSVEQTNQVPVPESSVNVTNTTNNSVAYIPGVTDEGALMDSTSTPPIVASKPWWETVLENVTKAVANSTQSQPAQSTVAADLEKEKRKSLTTILIVVAVVIVTGALMYFAFKKKN